MIDTQIMKDMLAGLKQKKSNLLESEKIFLKISGLNEEIEKANQEKEDYEKNLAEAKTRRNDAKKRKADAVSKTMSDIEGKVDHVLPFGKAVFTYDEDDNGNRSMKIGWKEKKEFNNGDGTVDVKSKITPYNGMSGMQKQVFDAALANVLDADIIVVEAAELDSQNLEKTLAELSKLDKQVIVNTCHPIDFEIPENFTLREV